MISNVRGFDIDIQERYGDLMTERWPIIPAPLPDELLSSWLHRLAFANGIATRAFAGVFGRGSGMWTASCDLKKLPPDIATLIRSHTGLSFPRIAAMSLAGSMLTPLLLPLRSLRRRARSTWMQFCPTCLAEDVQPYFRKQWRLACRVSCQKHRCGLRDRCPSCRSPIAAFDSIQLVAQHYCIGCGYDLRRASKIPISAPARCLDQSIDDALKRAATKGGGSDAPLLRSVLNAATIAGIQPAAKLPSLSAAMRIRCFERLADPGDWLIAGDHRRNHRKIATWHRSILSLECHGLSDLRAR